MDDVVGSSHIMKTAKDLFVETLADEIARFEKVVKALPKDNLSWRPHDKSRSAMELVVAMAVNASTMPAFLKSGKADFSEITMRPEWKTVDETWKNFEMELKESHRLASSMSDNDWKSKAVMMIDEKNNWESTKGDMAWGVLFDLIHHRGQLATYLRPMGGKVPAIYGPSGDAQI